MRIPKLFIAYVTACVILSFYLETKGMPFISVLVVCVFLGMVGGALKIIKLEDFDTKK